MGVRWVSLRPLVILSLLKTKYTLEQIRPSFMFRSTQPTGLRQTYVITHNSVCVGQDKSVRRLSVSHRNAVRFPHVDSIHRGV